jgi:hypothetical protein
LRFHGNITGLPATRSMAHLIRRGTSQWEHSSVAENHHHVPFIILSLFNVRYIHLWGYLGRAVAQAVSRWLLTAAVQVRILAEHVGFVVDKVVLGQVFSEYFGFPCQSSFQ